MVEGLHHWQLERDRELDTSQAQTAGQGGREQHTARPGETADRAAGRQIYGRRCAAAADQPTMMRGRTLCLLLLGLGSAAAAAEAEEQRLMLGGARPAPPGPPSCNEVSLAIGAHMVLQRAPERAVIYGTVCGKLKGATKVSVSVDGGAAVSVAIAAGASSWKVALEPVEGSLKPHTVRVTGGTLDTTLTDILFGDVVLCSGRECAPAACSLLRLSVCSAPHPPLRLTQRRRRSVRHNL
eukprot:SAG22_NODE_460_length_10218_cov_5.663109_4_plen_239_part_00